MASSQASPAGALGSRQALRALLDSPAAMPGALAVVVFLLWASYQAGFPATVWYPGALFLLGALTTVAFIARRPFSGLSRLTLAAVGCLAGYTLWSFLSILWANVRGDAWDGANRTLLYLVVFALFALWPWRSRVAAILLGAYSLGVTIVMLVYLVRAARAGDPSHFVYGARFEEPTGYPNANAALPLAAFWPAAFLASRRELPWPARAVMLASAGALVEVSVLAQSRGSAFALPIVLLVYLAIVPGRVRSLLVLALVGAATAAALRPLLDVYSSADSVSELHAALVDALRAVAVSFGALLVAGALVAYLDRRLELPERTTRTVARVVAALVVAAAIAGAAAAVVAAGNPFDRIASGWREFKATDSGHGGGGSSRFFGGLGSNRYDFWRVSVKELAESPLLGLGADNFAVEYLAERRSSEEPLYPHSVEVRIVSQGGVVGALLFAGFLGCALAAARRGWSRRSAFGRATAAAAVVAFSYWLVHGSVDWFWEYPGLAAPAFAWLGLAVGLAHPTLDEAPPSPRRARAARAAGLAAAAVLLLVCTTSLLLPWLAAREVDVAAHTWRQHPEAAYARLERARSLNFLSDRPDVIAGTIASRLRDWPRMEAAFERATARNPSNWYAQLELGLADWLERDRTAALDHLRRARELNPRESTIGYAVGRVRAGKPVPPQVIERTFLQRVQALTS